MRIISRLSAFVDQSPECRVVQIVDVAIDLSPRNICSNVVKAGIKYDARIETGNSFQLHIKVI